MDTQDVNENFQTFYVKTDIDILHQADRKLLARNFLLHKVGIILLNLYN